MSAKIRREGSMGHVVYDGRLVAYYSVQGICSPKERLGRVQTPPPPFFSDQDAYKSDLDFGAD